MGECDHRVGTADVGTGLGWGREVLDRRGGLLGSTLEAALASFSLRFDRRIRQIPRPDDDEPKLLNPESTVFQAQQTEATAALTRVCHSVLLELLKGHRHE
jgi:hypothetical protein